MNSLRILRIIVFPLCIFTIFMSFTGFTFQQEQVFENPAPASAEEAILLGLENCSEKIILDSYKMTSAEIMQILKKLIETKPQLFYVKPHIYYEFDEQHYVVSIYPQYSMSCEDIEAGRSFILKTFREIIIPTHAHMRDGDKALLIHDHIASTYTYSPSGEENYDIYSLLSEGHGVCQAFSLLYIALGSCIDLEVDMVTSEKMDHAWNHVYVEGQYYHVDVTRDLSSTPMDFSHDRFLLCDEALGLKGYRDYSCYGDHACRSHTYESLDENGNHLSHFAEIIGGSLPLGSGWLSLHADGQLRILYTEAEIDSNIRVTMCIDIDGDDILSVSDLLYVSFSVTSDQDRLLIQKLRYLLLEKALS